MPVTREGVLAARGLSLWEEDPVSREVEGVVKRIGGRLCKVAVLGLVLLVEAVQSSEYDDHVPLAHRERNA